MVRERELYNTMVNTMCEEEVNLQYVLEQALPRIRDLMQHLLILLFLSICLML